MTDYEIYEAFLKWILEQKDPDYRTEQICDDLVDFVTESATAHVQF